MGCAGVTLVLVRGGRVRRLGCRPAVLCLGLALLGLTVAAGALAAADYARLRTLAAEMPDLRRLEAAQRARLEGLEPGLAAVRRAVSGLDLLHARLREPFGPGPGAAGAGPGAGGGASVLDEALAPGPGGAVEALDRVAAAALEQGRRLRGLERLVRWAEPRLRAVPWRWPVHGAVNSGFGPRRSPWTGGPELHRGLDIAAHPNTPVRAPAPGLVAFAGTQAEYGRTLILDHGSGVRSLYGHLERILVSPGQRVGPGQVMALSGNTGRSSGPHLHYEVWVGGQAMNPREFLWAGAPR